MDQGTTEFDWNNCRWVILSDCPYLGIEDKVRLGAQAIDLHDHGCRRGLVQGEEYQGILTTKGKYYHVGQFVGQYYEARLHTHQGIAQMGFLVQEPQNRLN